MKRRMIVVLSIMVVLFACGMAWFNMPLDVMNLEPDEVSEIVIFNGNSGKTTHVTDKGQIQHIIENLNDVEVKRSKPSVGYSGVSFKLTMYLSDGNEADGWNNFIINSEDTIRKDPFFYMVTKGQVDYRYIERIAE